MSLNWSISDVKDWRELNDDENKEVTTAIVFATVAVGIPRITNKTVEEFCVRLALWQEAAGPLLTRLDEPRPITATEVYRRIGLTTNAKPKTQYAFKNDMYHFAYRKHLEAIREEIG